MVLNIVNSRYIVISPNPTIDHAALLVPINGLIDHATLLVPISGPIDPVVDRRAFTGLAKDRV